MNHIVESYENYREEDRLTTHNSRRIEFLTTIKILEAHLPPDGRLLDCAAGTGVYAFHYADLGYEVTALDLTPRHVEIMQQTAAVKPYIFHTAVNDAVNLGRFNDGTFDTVLCMGPLYHLIEKSMREKCISECVRVLKPGGLLAAAYINRYFVFPYVALREKKFLNRDLAELLLATGSIAHDNPNCFWTDAYFHTPNEIESEIRSAQVNIVDHAATDGLSPFLQDKVDQMTDEEFKIWCNYHYLVCREKSLMGASNHGLVIARKLM